MTFNNLRGIFDLVRLAYFTQPGSDGLVKIGFSWNVARRVKELQRSIPTLKILAAASLDESELHSKFGHLRKHGDWFAPKEELLEFIEPLKPKTDELVTEQRKNGMTAFGEWLQKRDISYADAGRFIGVTRSFVQLLATGKADPSTKVSWKIEQWTNEMDPADPVTVDSWA